jgi:glutathione S-transferase
MILIGQFDSPFVRRVGIALELYALPYEHRPWSTWANAEELAVYNPLRRVPTLLRDDGECLIESSAIGSTARGRSSMKRAASRCNRVDAGRQLRTNNRIKMMTAMSPSPPLG